MIFDWSSCKSACRQGSLDSLRDHVEDMGISSRGLSATLYRSGEGHPTRRNLNRRGRQHTIRYVRKGALKASRKLLVVMSVARAYHCLQIYHRHYLARGSIDDIGTGH
ncbi:hypothetical protein SCHPADRAFT_476709 [Schizopora paradoxa]|uniref:Uncharacterized protein n=1 Tax=Schizopora paradoxa TaxID=27342 RepID=A0A0H2RHC9_9AGAM|nr:hypothetical protein SCHPADRAFT_476709 [Schizopora paradoxa]